MKRTQLKEAIKQIVRQAINERKSMIREEAPPGKKAERAVMHVKKSLRDKHPDWDDKKITSVAIATAWKLHNKGSLEEDDKAPNIKKACKLNPKIVGKDNKPKASYSGTETNPIRKAGKLGFGLKQEAGLTSEDGQGYSEEAELELIKQIGQKVLELLAMHGAGSSDGAGAPPVAGEPEENEPEVSDTTPNPFEKPEDTEPSDNDDSGKIEAGEEEEEDELDEAAYKVVSPNQTDSAKEDKARKIQIEPKVSENYKVQTGPSCRTAKDSKDNPKNVRNPKLG